jgi:outer membrane protein OmpA-like peptidoglycan-associated protein
MPVVRSERLVIGVGLVVMGYAVVVISLAEQAQRSAALASTVNAAVEPSSPALTATATVTPPTLPAATFATSPPGAPAPSQGTPAGTASAPADLGPADSPEARLFKFSPGGAAMARDEVQRLIALGKVLAKHPVAKVSIEGFGDRAGSEPLMVGIAKHRAKVAQMLLAKAGVAEDRVTMAFVDMGSDPHLAQTIRITTLPPLSEVEKP